MKRKSHKEITDKLLKKSYYFSEWDYCSSCNYSQHYQEFKVLRPKKKKKIKWKDSPLNKSRKYLRYKVYIKSGAWRKRRELYYKTHEKRCVICKGDYQIGLHHKSYGRLGKEKDKDLVTLCWKCHQSYHEKHGNRSPFETTDQFIKEEKVMIQSRELDDAFERLIA